MSSGTSSSRHDSTLSATPSLAPVLGRPCVTGRMKGGMAGMLYGAVELCRASGRWVEMRTEAQEWSEGAKALVRVARERRGDSLVTVRVDTVPAT